MRYLRYGLSLILFLFPFGLLLMVLRAGPWIFASLLPNWSPVTNSILYAELFVILSLPLLFVAALWWYFVLPRLPAVERLCLGYRMAPTEIGQWSTWLKRAILVVMLGFAVVQTGLLLLIFLDLGVSKGSSMTADNTMSQHVGLYLGVMGLIMTVLAALSGWYLNHMHERMDKSLAVAERVQDEIQQGRIALASLVASNVIMHAEQQSFPTSICEPLATLEPLFNEGMDGPDRTPRAARAWGDGLRLRYARAINQLIRCDVVDARLVRLTAGELESGLRRGFRRTEIMFYRHGAIGESEILRVQQFPEQGLPVDDLRIAVFWFVAAKQRAAGVARTERRARDLLDRAYAVLTAMSRVKSLAAPWAYMVKLAETCRLLDNQRDAVDDYGWSAAKPAQYCGRFAEHCLAEEDPGIAANNMFVLATMCELYAYHIRVGLENGRIVRVAKAIREEANVDDGQGPPDTRCKNWTAAGEWCCKRATDHIEQIEDDNYRVLSEVTDSFDKQKLVAQDVARLAELLRKVANPDGLDRAGLEQQHRELWLPSDSRWRKSYRLQA